jgi:hypothetical protein
VRKAFDTVWYGGLMVKLSQYNVSSICGISWTTGTVTQHLQNSKVSRPFYIQGVHQVVILTPLLYSILWIICYIVCRTQRIVNSGSGWWMVPHSWMWLPSSSGCSPHCTDILYGTHCCEMFIWQKCLLHLKFSWLQIWLPVYTQPYPSDSTPLSAFHFYFTVASCGTLSGSELPMLEQVHRKILRTIQGLPLQCPSKTLLCSLGVSSISHWFVSSSSIFFTFFPSWQPNLYLVGSFWNVSPVG